MKDRKKKKPPEQLMSPEERAAIARANGAKGGRPPGSKNALPYGAVTAIKAMKFRVKKEYLANDAACEIAGDSFERIVKVMHGAVHSRKAPSVLKAAVTLREEICEPVVKEAKVSGTMSLESLVSKATDPEPEKE